MLSVEDTISAMLRLTILRSWSTSIRFVFSVNVKWGSWAAYFMISDGSRLLHDPK